VKNHYQRDGNLHKRSLDGRLGEVKNDESVYRKLTKNYKARDYDREKSLLALAK